MKNLLIIAVISLALPALSSAQLQPPEQVLAQPVTAYNEAKAERLRQEQMRLENERLQQEIERVRREDALRSRQEYEARMRQLDAEREQSEQREKLDVSTGPDKYERLIKLGQLRDDGILTEEEFQELKKRILAEE